MVEYKGGSTRSQKRNYDLLQEDPVMRCFRDAQHDTIADRRDSDVKNFNGWRSLPIVNSGGFAR